MHIVCSRQVLLDALKKINYIADPKAASILHCCKITAQSNKLILTSATIVSSIRVCVDAVVEGEMEVCLSARNMLGVITNLLGEEVEIDIQEDGAIIRSLETKVVLEVMSAKDFPAIDNNAESWTEIMEVDSRNLSKALLSCLPFADEIGPLASIRLFKNDSHIYCCGCRQTCAALVAVSSKNDDEVTPFNIVLQSRSVKSIIDIFTEGVIKLCSKRNGVVVLGDSTTLVVNVAQVTYPPVEKLVAQSYVAQLPIDKLQFESAFNLMDIVATKPIVRIEYADKQCSLMCNQLVDAHIQLEQPIEQCSFTVDYSLLRKVFKVTISPSIKVQFCSKTTPLLVCEDENKFLIAPSVDLKK